MADCATRRRRAGARLAFGGLLLVAAVLGCNRGRAPAPPPEEKPAPEAAKTDTPPEKAPPPVDPRLNQNFTEATRADVPPSANRPPDTTVTGKSVGKLYTDVVRLWKEIPFLTPEGKRVEYSATIETEVGTIEMALLSDRAPNHVRNFVALARAGYYDGLSFDRLRHVASDAPEYKGRVLDLIEAGDPLGTNVTPGSDRPDEYDSIGYWLKFEADPKADHAEGNVGSIRLPDDDSDGCKFYIIVSKDPPLPKGIYTVFGQVTKGLDVARKIHQRPAVELEEESGYSRPETPVVIRKVTIHTKEVDNPGASEEKK
jgi:peptidyl-prolyl cis-trans isomerase B (cyclophilin B)